MLKDVIEIEKSIKKRKRKQLKLTRINSSNSWPVSWDDDNFIENKLKQIMNSNSQST